MLRANVTCALALGLLAGAASAAPPSVVADIPPVQSLVAAVMGDLGTPGLLLPPGASPHDVMLRPSEARAVAGADLIVWIGPELSPGLARVVEASPAAAQRLALLEVPGTLLRPYRELSAAEGGPDHGPDHGHDHDHGATDPHAWLDPANARLWLTAIAATLGKADPDNAETYRANAARADAAVTAAAERSAATLAPVKDRRAVVFHDAYAYWEAAFGMPRALAISGGDAARPGPAHLAAIKAEIAAGDAACLLTEPVHDTKLATLVAEGSDLPVGAWDDLGSTLTPGPGLYPQLLEGMATAYATTCGG